MAATGMLLPSLTAVQSAAPIVRDADCASGAEPVDHRSVASAPVQMMPMGGRRIMDGLKGSLPMSGEERKEIRGAALQRRILSVDGAERNDFQGGSDRVGEGSSG